MRWLPVLCSILLALPHGSTTICEEQCISNTLRGGGNLLDTVNLGLPMLPFPIKYLGLPLSVSWLTKSDLRPYVDKVVASAYVEGVYPTEGWVPRGFELYPHSYIHLPRACPHSTAVAPILHGQTLSWLLLARARVGERWALRSQLEQSLLRQGIWRAWCEDPKTSQCRAHDQMEVSKTGGH